MKRYFRFPFFHADPMTEIDHAAAARSGSYIEEAGDGRYLCFWDHELSWVVYRNMDASRAIADAKARGEGVPLEVYSPIERTPGGGKRWQVCYVRADGTIEKTLEPEYDSAGRMLREGYRDASGQLRSYQEYTYFKDGEVREVVTKTPDGAVFNVDYDG